MIIDFHCHVGLSEDGACGKLDDILENMENYGISMTVLFATDEKDRGKTYTPLNDKVFGIRDAHRDKIIAFSRLVPSAGMLALEEFKRCVQLNAKGVKLKSDDGFTPNEARTLLEEIKKHKGMPVLLHTAHQPDNDPSKWEPFFADFPSIYFVLAHGGKDLYKKCADIVKRHQNVYADTTTLSYNRTRHLYEALGPQKLVFGSDYPYSHPAIELKKFEVLVKDPKAREYIFALNAKRILGI